MKKIFIIALIGFLVFFFIGYAAVFVEFYQHQTTILDRN